MKYKLVLSALLACVTVSAHPQSATYSVFAAFPGNTTVGGGSIGGLVQTYNGDFYGETTAFGANNMGDFYYATPSGTLHDINEICSTGSPLCTTFDSGFILASDGNFYGVTEQGGADGYGAIYRLKPSGALTVMHSFTDADQSDASYPVGTLVQGTDGSLYGEASQGGNLSDCPSQFTSTNGCGAIFKMSLDGTFSIVYRFTGGADYSSPGGGLVQGRDGNFYGVTYLSLFQVSPTGTFKTIAHDASGFNPTLIGPPVEDAAGNFYTVGQSGDTGAGNIYKVTPNGTFTSIYTLCSLTGCADGEVPLSPLQLLPNGNLIGTDSEGGDGNCAEGFGCGVIFEITTAGKLSVLYTFEDNDNLGVLAGNTPISGMDGNLYGTATNGDNCNQCGVLYKLSHSPALLPAVQVSLSSTTVAPGSPVTLRFNVNQATTDTAQQCYAFGGGTGAGTWSGKQSGTYNSTTAVYSGSVSITPTADGTYLYGLTCGGTVSGAATLTVATAPAKVNTDTALTITPATLYVGQNVSFSATVKKATGSGTPTGSVTFSVEGETLATVNLSSGVAAFSASSAGYPSGTYPIVATYNGDAADNASTSAPVTVKLENANNTTTTLTVNPTSVTPPGSVTLTATVKSSGGTPTGSVTFSANGEVLGTTNLNGSGVAVVSGSTSGVPAGTYPVTATYNGVTGFNKSTSTAVQLTVK